LGIDVNSIRGNNADITLTSTKKGSNTMTISLDELWSEVRTTVPKKAEKPAPSMNTFLNPEHWKRTKGIALIHKDTNTLLGNFSEYIHTSGARKLVRKNAPISVSCSEYVEGSWWLGESIKPEPRRDWHETRPAILHIQLPELHLHSPACEVTAHISYGGIARVELSTDTTFAQTYGPVTLLHLPTGTNILELMSLDSKIKLREEIGL